MTTKLEQLKAERAAHTNILNLSKDPENWVKKANQLDQEIKKEQTILTLNKINKKQTNLRNLALQVWECEQPNEDITCLKHGFHATKVKKYPKIAALKYADGTYKDGKLLTISVNGEKFRMYKETFISYEKGSEYTRPDTFEQFLSLNNIMIQEITETEFFAIIEENERNNQELEQAIKKAEEQRKKLNISMLNYWGLFRQEQKYLYTYNPSL